MTGIQIDSSFYVKEIQKEQSSANNTVNYIKQLRVITQEKEYKILKIPEDKVIEMKIPEDFDFDFGACMNFDECLEEKC